MTYFHISVPKFSLMANIPCARHVSFFFFAFFFVKVDTSGLNKKLASYLNSQRSPLGSVGTNLFTNESLF